MPHALPPKPRSNGLDYRGNDALLVADMRKMMADDETMGITDAARAVVARDAGKGIRESKITRLILRHRQTPSPE
jgi:hypothetical protein